jgi:hypothetical protein
MPDGPCDGLPVDVLRISRGAYNDLLVYNDGHDCDRLLAMACSSRSTTVSRETSAFISPEARLVPYFLWARFTCSSMGRGLVVLNRAMPRKWLPEKGSAVPDSSTKA